jgi:hypothetical protein
MQPRLATARCGTAIAPEEKEGIGPLPPGDSGAAAMPRGVI